MASAAIGGAGEEAPHAVFVCGEMGRLDSLRGAVMCYREDWNSSATGGGRLNMSPCGNQGCETARFGGEQVQVN